VSRGQPTPFTVSSQYACILRLLELVAPSQTYFCDMAAINRTSIVDGLACVLHADPGVARRVGDRVIPEGQTDKFILPDIIVDAGPSTKCLHADKIRIICRAKTPTEADIVGAAVVTALSGNRFEINDELWKRVDDRSGYDHASGTFRRVIFLEPKRG
jgi:hypothetical protein